MNTRQNFFTKYELPLFLLFTYILSWWSAPLMNGQLLPHGPALATIIVLGLTMGRKEIAQLWRRVTKWRIPWFDILIFSFVFQLIIAWVFYRSDGSVLAVMLLHFVSNLMGSFTYPVLEGAAHATYTALFMAAACLAAFLLIFLGGFSQRQRSIRATV